MTVGKSLVEDMARAICIVDACDPDALEPGNTPYGDEHEFVDGQLDGAPAFFLWRNYVVAAEAALAVLKDRLPADDRELVERLRNRSSSEFITVLLDEAADRITAYSASSLESGRDPAGRADAPSRSSASRPFGDHPA